MSIRLCRKTGGILITAFVLLAGCGVPTDTSPVQIEISASPTRSHPVGSSAVTFVFFIRKGQLVPEQRRIDSAHPVTQAVEALLNGVTDQEAADGLRSAIGNGVTLHGVTRKSDNHVAVDLGDALAAVGGSEQALAVAQIVFTVTQVDGELPVQILIDGTAVQVPSPDGTLIGRPLTRTDYRAVAHSPLPRPD